MVDLVEVCDVAVLEALDHVELPQRAASIEWPRHDALDLRRELPRASRGGKGDVSDVEVEIEVGVLDPVGLIEPERHLDESVTIRGNEVQPLADQRFEVVEVQRFGRGGRIEQCEPADVAVGRAGLDVEKERVET